MTTGADLVAAIRHKASELGVPVRQFAAPLSADVDKWLRRTSAALKPKRHTIERVRDLLAGATVEAPPPNNFQKSPRQLTFISVRDRADPASVPEPIDRDPCFWCGIRADIGCRHRSPA